MSRFLRNLYIRSRFRALIGLAILVGGLLYGLPLCALAECRLEEVTLESSGPVKVHALAQTLGELTGCNFIFEPGLEERTVELSLQSRPLLVVTQEIARSLGVRLVYKRTLFVFSKTKQRLSGTGRLVSFELKNAPLRSVNQILSDLGIPQLNNPDLGQTVSTSLRDVPANDLPLVFSILLSKQSNSSQ